ncbi:hypothetical protein BOX15_Mlig012049g1, partial [Macrostomum lignano]
AAASQVAASEEDGLTMASLKAASRLHRHVTNSGDSTLSTSPTQPPPALPPQASLHRSRQQQPQAAPGARATSPAPQKQATIHCERDLPLSIDWRQFDLDGAQLLGEGAFAYAYKVHHRGLGKAFVLKSLKRTGDGEFSQELCNFRKEVTTMQQLEHRNVLRFYGLLYTKKLGLTIVTELAERGSLHALLHKRPDERLSGLRRVLMAKQVASGVAYLHSRSIAHRDLTSSNCFLRADCTVLVGDFGLAAAAAAPNGLAAVGCVGSFLYASPEMFLGRPYGVATDAYSFGVLLCELALRLPPEPDRLPRLADSRLAFAVDVDEFRRLAVQLAPPDWPAGAVQLAVECVNPEPDRRPSLADAARRLDACTLPSAVGRVVL